MKRAVLLLALALPILAGGCSSFERESFNTLSASKAVIDQAQVDYEARTIPKTQCAYSLINNAKAVQTAGVNALQTYHSIVVAKGDTTATEAVVVSTLAQLAPLVVQVQSLISNPATLCAGSSSVTVGNINNSGNNSSAVINGEAK